MKARIIGTAIFVILSAIAAIAAVLQSPPTSGPTPTEPAQTEFNQPSIGKDPTAYGPLFKPNKPGKPGCDGPNCP